MTAALRFGLRASAIALALATVPALAQEAPPATNTPATDSVGPRELQNFSIEGTVTREGEQAPVRTTTAPAPTRTVPPPAAEQGAGRAAAPRSAPAQPVRESRPATSAATEIAAAPAVSTTLPPADVAATSEPSRATTTSAPIDFAPHEEAASAAGIGVIPWLLALALLAAGAGYFFWRQRSAPALAPAGVGHRYANPAPAPVPQPEPLKRAPAPEPAQRAPAPPPARTPPPATPAQPVGVVSTRLRPWLDIEFAPGRCIVDDEKATIEFDITVFNSGSAPARNVLVEARLFNAGPTQDQEIGEFFAHPVAQGERIPVIPQLKRMSLKSAVTLPRVQMRVFEVEGRRLLVPLIGFNALYNWSSGEGQTSASYLLGRENNGEKLAPLRLDLGSRIFRGLGFRKHTLAVRK